MHRPGASGTHQVSGTSHIRDNRTKGWDVMQNQLRRQQRLQFPTTPKSPQVAALRDRPAAAVNYKTTTCKMVPGGHDWSQTFPAVLERNAPQRSQLRPTKKASQFRLKPRRPSDLLSNSQLTNDANILFGCFGLQIVQQPPSTADHRQQTTSTGMVLLVGLQMSGKVLNLMSKDSDLHLG